MNATFDSTHTADYLARQSRLARLLEAAGLQTVALNPGPTLTYLTGLHFHLMERPVVAFFRRQGPVVLVLPELETGKTADLPFPIHTFPYGENPQSWPAAFERAARDAGIETGRVGVEPTGLRYLELRYLETAAPRAGFVPADGLLAELRMRKEPVEIAKMSAAVQIAQQALRDTLPNVRPGMTERQVASELVVQLLRAGSQSVLPFEPIVSFGPNSANPHASPGQRELAPGDLLLIDWGANVDGYLSDLTRTFGVGRVDAELEEIYRVVLEANQTGRAAVRPGIPASAVDRAARQVIEAAGYGEFFIHRTGHGLGMESHEAPYIRSDNQLLLETGMTFTMEPGIYLPGKGGVRIEDDVVVTETGGESLSDYPRDWTVLG